jgi:ferredoxin
MMSELNLPDRTTNGQARAAALHPRHRPDVSSTSLVNFLSHGRVLIVGAESAALDAARRLEQGLVPTLFAPSDAKPATGTVEGLTILRGGQPRLSGSLGGYRLSLGEPGQDDEPATVLMLSQARFDLVLDLGESPLLQQEIPPPGYYAPRGDPEALESAIAELPGMRGEFEKPKYFNYDPDICAHGERGIKGCTRCLDVCPAWAIKSVGQRVSVDPQLCQGFGTCASVCPTGAITYAFPSTGDLLGYVRTLLLGYLDAGGSDPLLIFYDNASAEALAGELAERLPENALPIQLEEVGSLGMDAWLTCLAYGARRVLVLTGADTPRSIGEVIQREIEVGAAILEGMGYPGDVVEVLDAADVDAVAAAALSEAAVVHVRPARHTPPPEKRLLLQLAIDHLLDQAPTRRKVVPLPQGAPFGQVKVDKSACTLCMSCVAVCPTSALRDAQGLPQLNFVEWSCIQCGMCDKACPEDAVSLEPRFLYDAEERSAWRRLHEEQPICCISCGKPFATRSMLKVMMKKLEGHWMFQTDADRRRLEMCDTCRVKDLMVAQRSDGPGER